MGRWKMLLLSVFGLLTIVAKAEEEKYENRYEIISESIDESLEKDVAVVKGKIISNLDVSPIGFIGFQREGSVGKNERTSFVHLPDNSFKMKMKSGTGLIFAYTNTGNEIILPMKEYKGQTVIEINFYSDDAPVPAKPPTVIRLEPEEQLLKKPVLYLYSDQKIKTTLELSGFGKMTFSYPQLKNDSWSVELDENGLFVDGKQYPYLFWESEKQLRFQSSSNKIEANIVQKNELVSFFEEKLDLLGLNFQEKTDFITFWAPQLQNLDEVAIQFISTKEYGEEIAGLKSDVPIDNLNRIYMLYTKVDDQNRNKFVKQEIKSENFERKGFTVVEWGGSEVPIDIEDVVKK